VFCRHGNKKPVTRGGRFVPDDYRGIERNTPGDGDRNRRGERKMPAGRWGMNSYGRTVGTAEEWQRLADVMMKDEG
jgi:hypothetical protein